MNLHDVYDWREECQAVAALWPELLDMLKEFPIGKHPEIKSWRDITIKDLREEYNKKHK